MATQVKTSTTRTAARTRDAAASWQSFANSLGFWLLAILPVVLMVGAATLWWQSLPAIDVSSIDDFGLSSALPISFYGALLILNLSFALVASRQEIHTPTLFAHVFLLIIIIHGTLPLIYEVPRYAWTYKHLGVIDYVQRFGMVNPLIDAYQNWPGFFTFMALVSEVTGIDNFMGIAGWAQVFWNLLYLGALRMMYRAFTKDSRLIWLAIWIFFLTNWVGQDYFAPQAFGFFLHLVVLGIFLTWFQVKTNLPVIHLRQQTVWTPLTNFYRSLVIRFSKREIAGPRIESIQQTGLALVAVAAFFAVISSHQLTPFMTLSTILALLIFKRCRRRDLLILMVVLQLTWLTYMSITFLEGANLAVFQSIGRLFSNIDDSLKDYSQSSPGRLFASRVIQFTTLGVWGLAFLGAIRRLRNGYWDIALFVVTVTPFFLIAMQSYGGEMMLRIYLFSLPGMAFLVGAMLYPGITSRFSWKVGIITLLTSVILTGSLFYTYFGNELVNHVAKGEIEALEKIYYNAPRGSLILAGSPNSATKFANYSDFRHYQLIDLPEFRSGEIWTYKETDFTDQDLQALRDFMAEERFTNAYFYLSTSQKSYISAYNNEQADYLDRLEVALRRSGLFEVAYVNEDAVVFVLAEATYGVQ